MITLFAVRLWDISPRGSVRLRNEHFQFSFDVYLKNQVAQKFAATILPQEVDDAGVRAAARID